MTFGEKLIFLRKNHGFTQEQLSEQLGISRQALSRWETNETLPDIESLKKICDIFNVSSDSIIYDTSKPIEKNQNEPTAKHEPNEPIIKRSHLIIAIIDTITFLVDIVWFALCSSTIVRIIVGTAAACMATAAILEYVCFFKKK